MIFMRETTTTIFFHPKNITEAMSPRACCRVPRERERHLEHLAQSGYAPKTALRQLSKLHFHSLPLGAGCLLGSEIHPK